MDREAQLDARVVQLDPDRQAILAKLLVLDPPSILLERLEASILRADNGGLRAFARSRPHPVGQACERQAKAEHLLGQGLGIVGSMLALVRGRQHNLAARAYDPRNARVDRRSDQ